MPYADCRKCVYFIPLDELDSYRREQALVYEARTGGNVLGWCRAREKYVTYYQGYCWLFRRKRLSLERNAKSLLDYFEV